MKRLPALKRLPVVALLAFAALGDAVADQQQIILGKGWNAVFLEVEPSSDARTPVDVFGPVADDIEAVWAWLDPQATVQFIVDPAEEGWNAAGWHVWFPEATDKGSLSNLYAILGGTAYLVRMKPELEGTRKLTVEGAPWVDSGNWVADSFNLRGLLLDRTQTTVPTFADYLGASPAHAGQPIYQLDSGGQWRPIANPAQTPIQAGEAYWFYTSGDSDYQGPIEYLLPTYDGIHFGRVLTRLQLYLGNPSSEPRTLSLSFEGDAIALEARIYSSETGYFEWISLADLPSNQLVAGGAWLVTLAVRREQMGGGNFTGSIIVKNNVGQRISIPVTASKDG